MIAYGQLISWDEIAVKIEKGCINIHKHNDLNTSINGGYILSCELMYTWIQESTKCKFGVSKRYFQLTDSSIDNYEVICISSYYHNFGNLLFSHCLRVDDDKMVCAVCLAMFALPSIMMQRDHMDLFP